MYGPGVPQPLTEKTPQRAAGKKGGTRILMAGRLLEAHGSGLVRVAIGRSSDYCGPRRTGTIAGETVFGAAAGLREWTGDGVYASGVAGANRRSGMPLVNHAGWLLLVGAITSV